MNELGLQIDPVLPWFVSHEAQLYTRVSIPPAAVATWGNLLHDAVRRCYISDQRLAERAQLTGLPQAQILASKLPDPGAVMSGDFGEILTYIYLASRDETIVAAGPKRWRLKENRTKSAPCSDVVQFVLHDWPNATTQDRLICAEVKAKATTGNFAPIADAIDGSQLDSTSRLARTLMWLRDRALGEDIGVVDIPKLNRFINATEFPAYTRQFHAVAVICSNLVEAELATLVPATIPANCALVVISVPDLRNTYTTVYQGAQASVADAGGQLTEVAP